MWRFLVDIYNGGPELVIKQQTLTKTTRSSSPSRSSPPTRSSPTETRSVKSKDSGIDSSSQRSENSVKEDGATEKIQT